MTPWLAHESLIVEMAKAVRDFSDLKDFVHRLRAAGYSDREIIDNGGSVWERERERQRLKLARAV